MAIYIYKHIIDILVVNDILVYNWDNHIIENMCI